MNKLLFTLDLLGLILSLIGVIINFEDVHLSITWLIVCIYIIRCLTHNKNDNPEW